MNTRRLAAIAAAFLFSLSAFAQSYPNSVLWRISGKDGHPTSYLYGSMHLTDERIFDLGDSLYAAIRNSDDPAAELIPAICFALEGLLSGNQAIDSPFSPHRCGQSASPGTV